MARSPLPQALAGSIERASALDAPAQRIGGAIRSALPAGAPKDALSGTWLGHALHPLLTDVVIGTWASALLLDLVGGEGSEEAAERLLAVGLASAPVTFATGWTDWADAETGSHAVRRAGVVHALSNGTAAAFMAASLRARRRDARGRGKLLSAAGFGIVGFGGWLGAHLSYSLGVGVNTNALARDVEEWAPAVDLSALREGQPHHALVEGVGVLLVRQGDAVRALADRCSHRGGPLHEGELDADTVTCPWHGSCFRLSDGSVVRGPAAHPQPVYDTRVVDDMVEVRVADAKSFVAVP